MQRATAKGEKSRRHRTRAAGIESHIRHCAAVYIYARVRTSGLYLPSTSLKEMQGGSERSVQWERECISTYGAGGEIKTGRNAYSECI